MSGELLYARRNGICRIQDIAYRKNDVLEICMIIRKGKAHSGIELFAWGDVELASKFF